MLLLLSPSAWSSSVLAPIFLALAIYTSSANSVFLFQCSVFRPSTFAQPLSLLANPLRAHGCRILVYVDGTVLVSHFHTFHFHYLFHFNAVPNFLPSTSARPSSKRLYSSLASPPTFFHRPHHFPSFVVERFCSFLCMHAHFFVIFNSSLSLHISNGTSSLTLPLSLS